MSNACKLLTLLFSLTLTFSAIADQAVYIEKEDANRAKELLKNAKIIQFFCAPCGEKEAVSVLINKIEIVKTGYEDFWMVEINDEKIDLAYSYLLKNNKWKNIAIELGIPTERVPEILELSTKDNVSYLTIESVKELSAACSEGKFRTSDLLKCMSSDYENWDKLLNQSYNLLMEKLDSDQKSILKNTQLAWMKYKELEYQNIDSLLKNSRGTMYSLISYANKVDITKQRAIQLNSYLLRIINE